MPHRCCVPGCTGNYRKGPKVRVFGFPKDPEESRKWLRAIRRENFVITEHSKVCERHFAESDVLKSRSEFDEKNGIRITVPYVLPKLKKGAIPSLLPGLPNYMSAFKNHRETPEEKKKRREEDALKLALEKSAAEKRNYDLQRTFSSLEELMLKQNYLDTFKWSVVQKSDSIIIGKIFLNPTPMFQCGIIIDSNLSVNPFIGEAEVKKVSNYHFPFIVSHFDILNNILKLLEDMMLDKRSPNITITKICNMLENMNTDDELLNVRLKFIQEQLSLITVSKNGLRYSSDMMIFASLFFNIAPHAYNFVRKSGNILLPHPCTIRRICVKFNVNPNAEICTSNFLSYMKQKYPLLNDNDKKVILMLDEIHLKQYLDFKGGNICGLAFNTQSMANSAHVFMISSLLSKYKDVVHVLPVHTINADILHKITKQIIVGLEKIGFFVICVVSDNNSINRKCMSFFASPPEIKFVYGHPCNITRPLFYVVDTVHLFKCVRNNWLNQRNPEKCMLYPPFEGNETSIKCASWSTLKELHNLELNSLVKYGFNLSYKALNPSNLERQNVRLVGQVFNDFVVNGLLEVGKIKELADFQSTSDFIKIIVTWWNIVNVKTPYKGVRLNNIYQTPLTYSDEDEKVIFLNSFINWLDRWEEIGSKAGSFSRETHSALILSSHSLLEIASYCTSELNLSYILPGKFQTDNLESRFGLYRQLAGSQYNISIRQLYEVESKLRVHSLLKLSSQSKIDIYSLNFKDDFNEINLQCVCNSKFNISVSPSDIDSCADVLPIIIYIAGYCALSVIKHLKCNSCKEMLLTDKTIELDQAYEYVKKLDRGKLHYPVEGVINAVLINYIVVRKLCTEFERDFLNMPNQRNIATYISCNLLANEELFIDQIICDSEHNMNEIVDMIIWSSANTFLNNYCKMKNDSNLENLKNKKIHDSSRKRKLSILKS